MTHGDTVEIFKALADPTRLKMYRVLLHEELCGCELAAVFGVTASAVSQHLRRLRSVNLVTQRRRGQWIFHRSASRPVAEVLALLTGGREQSLGEQEDLAKEWRRLRAVRRAGVCTLRARDGRLPEADADGGAQAVPEGRQHDTIGEGVVTR